MNELLSATLLWLPATLIPVALVLSAPTLGPRGRTIVAAILGLDAAAALVRFFLADASPSQLEVINPFLDPGVGEPIPFVVETVSASSGTWHLTASVFLALPAIAIWLLRNRPPGPPCPVTGSLIVTAWTLTCRLALEKSAAPEPLTWAIGVSMPLTLILPFVGWWSGRGFSFKKFCLVLLLIGIGQRALVVTTALLATMFELGTHLDVTAIQRVTLLLGERDFTGPGDHHLAQWWWLVAIPQFLLWVPVTFILGLILGGIPYSLATRSAGDSEA